MRPNPSLGCARSTRPRSDAEREGLLLRELTHVRSLSRFVTRLQASPRQFALCVSNVPGPRGPVSVLGVPVLSLSGLAEIGQRHALRVAAVSLGDQMSLGFCADPSIVPGVRLMAAAAATEAMDLISASRRPWRQAPSTR
jgi:uncharacterized protein DUF1298